MSVDSSTYISSDGSVKESSLVAIRTPDIPSTEVGALSGFYSDITAAIQATSSNMNTLQDMAAALFEQLAKAGIVSRSQGLGQQYGRFSNGLQICWLGDWMSSNIEQLDFPVPFKDDNYVAITNVVAPNSSYEWSAYVFEKTSTYCKIKVCGIPQFVDHARSVVNGKGEVIGTVSVPVPVWPSGTWGYQTIVIGWWK
jgi:hypothetical protein